VSNYLCLKGGSVYGKGKGKTRRNKYVTLAMATLLLSSTLVASAFICRAEGYNISNKVQVRLSTPTELTADEYTLALWHFDEGSGQTVYDSSSHGNNGTFGTGREPSWTTGFTGQPGDYALSFDDWYDYVYFPDNPDGSLNLLGGNQFTIEFWTYLRQISRDGYHWNYFMSKNQGTQTGWGICQCTAIPMIQAYFWYDPTNNFQNSEINPPPTNEWVHIMVIYDGHFLYVFFNDALQTKQDVGSHFVANNSQPLTIGKDLGGDVPWNDAVDGIIDEVRISSIARLHDVSSTDIVPSKTVVGKGYSAQINVTIANRGAFTETFNVTAHANGTAIGTQTVDNLNMNTSALMAFDWNTTEFAYGNYTLENCADVVPGEVNADDNNCTCPIQVHVGVPGDVSGATVGIYDGKCDMRDIAYLVSLFNTKPSSSNWNPNADVNNDIVCNMKDIAIAVIHFSQHE
jgi:hypothetical protein